MPTEISHIELSEFVHRHISFLMIGYIFLMNITFYHYTIKKYFFQNMNLNDAVCIALVLPNFRIRLREKREFATRPWSLATEGTQVFPPLKKMLCFEVCLLEDFEYFCASFNP